jgi:hypothetical protein
MATVPKALATLISRYRTDATPDERRVHQLEEPGLAAILPLVSELQLLQEQVPGLTRLVTAYQGALENGPCIGRSRVASDLVELALDLAELPDLALV